jgi:hypothetical protein
VSRGGETLAYPTTDRQEKTTLSAPRTACEVIHRFPGKIPSNFNVARFLAQVSHRVCERAKLVDHHFSVVLGKLFTIVSVGLNCSSSSLAMVPGGSFLSAGFRTAFGFVLHEGAILSSKSSCFEQMSSKSKYLYTLHCPPWLRSLSKMKNIVNIEKES